MIPTMLLLFSAALVFLLLIKMIFSMKSNRSKQEGILRVAFFHPFCNDGGGGEKVLWAIVNSLLTRSKHEIAIYSLEADKASIIQRAKSRFGIDLLKDRIKIIHVAGKGLLLPQKYLTMVWHILLPLLYSLKCLWAYQPDVFYDTTGYASSLFLTKLLLPACKTFAYVHYPFISADMIDKIKQKKTDFNNDARIAKSPLKSKLKIIYYQALLLVYKFNGLFVDFAQVNSTWTMGHMSQLWNQHRLVKLYPPCTVSSLLSIQKKAPQKQVTIISLAQFRPEKKQLLQINIFAALKQICTQQKTNHTLKMQICGTTRGLDDERILEELKQKVKHLKLTEDISFVVNQPFSKIMSCLKFATIGLHTMEAEHFGISIVEMLAAGLAVVAHNSAGPKEDIVKNPSFLAETEDDYVRKIHSITQLSPEQFMALIKQNRKNVKRFGQDEFSNLFWQQFCEHIGQKQQ